MFNRIECRECGCRLWSEESKALKLCPECRDVDFYDNAELEEKLDQLLEDK